VEARLAVGMIKLAAVEQPWRARMGVIRARPEDALLALNFLVGNAVNGPDKNQAAIAP
jgi:hypothetical protein